MTLRHDTTAVDRLLNQNWRVMGDNNYHLNGPIEAVLFTMEIYFNEPVTIARERVRRRFEFTLN